jgi:hypothetical protein
MVIKETRMHMATPEACFQATTADQCHHQLQLFLPARSLYWTTSFRASFESLCKDDLSVNIRHLLATLGPLNIFALTSGKLQSKPPWSNLVNTVTISNSFTNLPIPQRGRQLPTPSPDTECTQQLARHLAVVLVDVPSRNHPTCDNRRPSHSTRGALETNGIFPLRPRVLAPSPPDDRSIGSTWHI